MVIIRFHGAPFLIAAQGAFDADLVDAAIMIDDDIVGKVVADGRMVPTI